ncbi:MAG: hypothetical protein WCA95_13405 [Opitutaceae bacterium]
MNIQVEIDRMGSLKSAAQMLVDYARAVTEGSDFVCYTEWNLEPDNWLVISFNYIRTKTITLTLGVPLGSLPDVTGLNVNSRFSWARIRVKAIEEMPAVMQCLRYAHLNASNKYRKRSGRHAHRISGDLGPQVPGNP